MKPTAIVSSARAAGRSAANPWLKVLLVLAGVLALPLAGWAETPAASAPSATQMSLTAQLAQLGVGLMVVVALIFVLGWLMRRIGPMAGQGDQHIRLVSSMALGPRDRLLLVDVGGKQLLLGASPGRINTLHVFDEPVADLSSAKPVDSDFARRLQTLLKRESDS